MDLGAVVLLATLVPPGVKPEPPKGPDRTRLCIENATDHLVGAWLAYQGYPIGSRTVEAGTADCRIVAGYSQWVRVFVGKGERDVPGTTSVFPGSITSKAGAECPSYIEGGVLTFKVTKPGDRYDCQIAR